MIAPNSSKYIIGSTVFGILFLYFSLYEINNLLFILLPIFCFGFAIFLIWFFRDPKRQIILNENNILAAADGTVIYVEQLGNELKIAVRMSPFNVHINRAPISGTIKLIEHTPGKHHNVYFGDIESKNERNLTVIKNKILNCEVLQLTGSFARRIEVWKKLDDRVEQGEKFGIIRFGSQTNVSIMLLNEKKHILTSIRKGDKVKAGLSVIAEIRD